MTYYQKFNHLIASNRYIQYYDSVHLASDQKDLLISQLKAEIFEIE